MRLCFVSLRPAATGITSSFILLPSKHFCIFVKYRLRTVCLAEELKCQPDLSKSLVCVLDLLLIPVSDNVQPWRSQWSAWYRAHMREAWIEFLILGINLAQLQLFGRFLEKTSACKAHLFITPSLSLPFNWFLKICQICLWFYFCVLSSVPWAHVFIHCFIYCNYLNSLWYWGQWHLELDSAERRHSIQNSPLFSTDVPFISVSQYHICLLTVKKHTWFKFIFWLIYYL